MKMLCGILVVLILAGFAYGQDSWEYQGTIMTIWEREISMGVVYHIELDSGEWIQCHWANIWFSFPQLGDSVFYRKNFVDGIPMYLILEDGSMIEIDNSTWFDAWTFENKKAKTP